MTDSSEVEAFLRRERFTHVVNCAAYTAVDRAEEQKAQCAAANIAAVENIARLADELGFSHTHISTDYIFDGMACRPYDESAKPNPLNVYGSTKRRGETALLGLAPESVIIRTDGCIPQETTTSCTPSSNVAARTNAWRWSWTRPHPHLRSRPGSGGDDRADSAAWMPGIYNYSNEGIASWYDFAVAILETAGMHRRRKLLSRCLPPTTPHRRCVPHTQCSIKVKLKQHSGYRFPIGRHRCASASPP